MSSAEIPLFPLATVLFPEGSLPLRIFETRYTDMVRRCMRDDTPFGVVLIFEGREVGTVGSVAAVGTTARIVDFARLEDGLLGIRCRGEQRFRLLASRRQSDGLHIGTIELLEAAPAAAVPEDCRHLVEILDNAWAKLGAQYEGVAFRRDDAGWVCARLAEWLPLPKPFKQRLLESDDAVASLRLLASLIKPEQADA
ncbi:MAG: LON peptidase substrate-binding domain-containing protein [Steroidobacteraceae bacterium]|nr:LON peptidase substrate-binding domain-containing protein [Steroidobacteraceae bacterium]MDW8258054.1 LON peptidase substrate-binding domain-containing protein [Gammaproteobacteria bacterium]